MLKVVFNRVFVALCTMFFLSNCSPGTSAFVKPTPSAPPSKIVATGIVISSPAIVPVFAHTSTNTGIWIHNIDGKAVSDITIGDGNLNSTPSTIRSLIRNLPDLFAHHANVGYKLYSSNFSDFIIAAEDKRRCIDVINNKKGSQCYLPFVTPVVSDPSENGSVLLSVVSDNNKSYSQIISWEAIASASQINLGSYFTNLPATVSSDQYVTAYVYVGASGSIASTPLKLNFDVNPSGSAIVTNGYTNSLEVLAGQIIPIEIKINSSTNITKGVQAKSLPSNIELQTSILSGNNTLSSSSTLSLSVVNTNIGANLVASNTPVLFMQASGNYKKSYKVYLVNNGSSNATNISISPGTSVVSISNDTCTPNLAIGASCSYDVTAVSAGNSTISYTYTSANLEPVVPLASTSITVIDNRSRGAYVIYTAAGAQSIAISKGLSAESSTFSISFFNSAISPESAKSFTIESYLNGLGVSVIKNSTTCPSVLSPNTSCAASFTISSTSITPESGYVGAKFSFNTLTASNTNTSYALSPYFVYGDPYLVFQDNIVQDPAPTYTIDTNGNNIESKTKQVFVINTGVESAIIQSTLFTPTPLPNQLSLLSNTCTNGRVLNPNESCIFVVKLGPKGVSQTINGTNSYNVNYANGRFPTRLFSSTAVFDWAIQDVSPYFEITKIESFPVQYPGAGNSILYKGASSAGGVQQLKITYQNKSQSVAATNFALNLSSLPSLFTLDSSSTCGGAPTNVAANATCILVLNINRPVIPYVSANSGVANMSFVYPNATWSSAFAVGVKSESRFQFNNDLSFNGFYQSAMIRTIFTPDSGAWESTQAIQSITNAEGYDIRVVSSVTGQLHPNVFEVTTPSSGCSYDDSRGVLEVVCVYSAAALSGGGANSEWGIHVISTDIADANLGGYNWSVQENAVDVSTPSNPIVNYNQYQVQLSR